MGPSDANRAMHVGPAVVGGRLGTETITPLGVHTMVRMPGDGTVGCAEVRKMVPNPTNILHLNVTPGKAEPVVLKPSALGLQVLSEVVHGGAAVHLLEKEAAQFPKIHSVAGSYPVGKAVLQWVSVVTAFPVCKAPWVCMLGAGQNGPNGPGSLLASPRQ